MRRNGQPQLSGDARRVVFASDAPLGSFDTGAGALTPTAGALCSLAPSAW